MIDNAKRRQYAQDLAYMYKTKDDEYNDVRWTILCLLTADITDDELEYQLNEKIKESPSWIQYENALLAMKEPETVYEKILAKHHLTVQFITHTEISCKEPFKIRPLCMIGEFSVSRRDMDWYRFASVEGIIIIGQNRQCHMERGELKEWCSHVEEVVK